MGIVFLVIKEKHERMTIALKLTSNFVGKKGA
jgi:hypothetical protein